MSSFAVIHRLTNPLSATKGVAFSGGNYLFKVNNENTKTRCEICLNLAIKTPERGRLTYFTSSSTVSIVNFQQANAGWDFI